MHLYFKMKNKIEDEIELEGGTTANIEDALLTLNGTTSNQVQEFRYQLKKRCFT